MKYLSAIKCTLFVASLAPLAWLALNGYVENLGANPIEVITRTTGTWTLVFLLITLSITPLRKISGWHRLMRLRRMFGLFAFFYACLHFTTYIWLDQFFDLDEIAKDIAKRPFITVGFASFVSLIPLALTSNRQMITRLGKRWQQLHRAVYFIAIGGVVHYLWLVKADTAQPLLYGAILTLLLTYRLLAAWQLKTTNALRTQARRVVRDEQVRN